MQQSITLRDLNVFGFRCIALSVRAAAQCPKSNGASLSLSLSHTHFTSVVQGGRLHDSYPQSDERSSLCYIHRNLRWILWSSGKYTNTHMQMSVKYALMVKNTLQLCTHTSSLVHFTAGLPDGVLPTFQGHDWETRVSLWLDGHDHGTEQVLQAIHTCSRSQ